MDMQEKIRLDKYLWAIRLFKSRGLATEAIDKGKVKYNSENVKPSKVVHVGDKYQIKTEARFWVIEVTGLIEKRVGYQEAILNYKDCTPPELLELNEHQASSFFTGKRLSKVGRPTKKDRRDLQEFKGDE
jgi:ribosome-associated heat shock protein Hsp15